MLSPPLVELPVRLDIENCDSLFDLKRLGSLTSRLPKFCGSFSFVINVTSEAASRIVIPSQVVLRVSIHQDQKSGLLSQP